MTLSDLRLAAAEGITSDQLRQLAAVMLGLVVFAAVFILVERQRSRRGGDDLTPPRVEDLPSPPPVEYPPWTPSPPRESAAPLTRGEDIQDELPVPFVPRGPEPAPAAAPPSPPAAAAGADVV